MNTLQKIQIFNKNRSNLILKAFGIEDSFEKARAGIYENTPENRKLGRVGQKYGNKKEEEKIDHNKIKDILDKAQISYKLDISFKNNSHYWAIDNDYYRISDHLKPEGMMGSDFYKVGKNDFRNYNDFYKFLKNKYDLTNKEKLESEYKEKAKKYIVKVGEDFKQPDGSLFSSLDAALSNMWRLKKNLS